MKSFEMMGQARLDAAEGQRVIGLGVMRWLRQAAIKLIDAVCRHLPESRTAPW
jgi:hypothetical protein